MLILRTAVLPSVIADEQFYLNLAHSLYTGQGISVYGQPAVHEYFIYPLILAPLFALPESVNIYQAVILLNCVLCSLSVFPVYAISRRITGKRALSVGVAALCLLLPDLFMARHIMVESLALPLVLTALYVCLWALQERRLFKEIIVGLTCALLYVVKPGYIAVGGAYCLVSLYHALRGRGRTCLRGALLPAAVMLACAALYQLMLSHLLGMDFSAESIYDAQSEALSIEHIFVSMQGMFAYMSYGLIGFCALPVLFSLRCCRALPDERRDFAALTLLACLFTLLGCAYAIYYGEFRFNGNNPLRIHLRYVCFFLPALLTFQYAPEMQGDRLKGALGPVGGVFLCGLTFFFDAFHNQDIHTIIDSPLLTAYKHQPDSPLIAHLILPVTVLILLILVALIAFRGFQRPLRVASTAVVALLLLMNSCRMYQQDVFARDYTLDANAKEAVAMTPGSAVYICADNALHSYPVTALDVHSRCSIPPVTLDSLLAATAPDGTLQATLMPQSLNGFIRTTAVNAYDRPEHLIFQPGMNDGISFSYTSGYAKTQDEIYLVLTLPEDGKWIHSGIIGLANKQVAENSRFLLYDEELRAQPFIRLELKMRADTEGASVTLTAADGQQAVFTPVVSEKSEWYTADFAITDPEQPFILNISAQNGAAYIDNHLVSIPLN